VKDFFVTYDLIKRKDYPTLWTALERLGARRVMLSVWEFQANSTAKQVRDHLAQHIDADDRLLVMDVQDWASRNLLANPATAAA
jgi:hypothetical protein